MLSADSYYIKKVNRKASKGYRDKNRNAAVFPTKGGGIFPRSNER